MKVVRSIKRPVNILCGNIATGFFVKKKQEEIRNFEIYGHLVFKSAR